VLLRRIIKNHLLQRAAAANEPTVNEPTVNEPTRNAKLIANADKQERFHWTPDRRDAKGENTIADTLS
jgi:hypothetical protein